MTMGLRGGRAYAHGRCVVPGGRGACMYLTLRGLYKKME